MRKICPNISVSVYESLHILDCKLCIWIATMRSHTKRSCINTSNISTLRKSIVNSRHILPSRNIRRDRIMNNSNLTTLTYLSNFLKFRQRILCISQHSQDHLTTSRIRRCSWQRISHIQGSSIHAWRTISIIVIKIIHTIESRKCHTITKIHGIQRSPWLLCISRKHNSRAYICRSWRSQQHTRRCFKHTYLRASISRSNTAIITLLVTIYSTITTINWFFCATWRHWPIIWSDTRPCPSRWCLCQCSYRTRRTQFCFGWRRTKHRLISRSTYSWTS